MKRLITIILIIFIFTGCATLLTKDTLKTRSTLNLCGIYGHSWTTQSTKDEIMFELNQRDAIKPWEYDLIKVKKIKMGMSRNALYASWGGPYKCNKSVGRYGVYIQHIYGMQYSTYVYTQNGEVTGWQD